LLIWQDPVELRAVALVAWMPTKDVSVFEDTYPSEAPNSTFIRGTMLNPCWAKIVASKLTDAFSRTCTPCVFFCYELIRILNFKCGQISISSIKKTYDTGRNYFAYRIFHADFDFGWSCATSNAQELDEIQSSRD
jgi:hypothetical protein